MHIRCPHCRQPVEVVEDDPLAEITCPSCGSSFHLISGDSTDTYHHGVAMTIGHFELLERLGQGHVGTVWKSHDSELDRTVAVKIPRKEHLDPGEMEQFLREARAAAQLTHPNIVPVHEVGVEEQTVYIVSEYVQGLTLADWLTAQQVTAREAAELCVKIADALHHAHQAGVIHRDLKPSNVMLDAQGEPRIMDFGLAKREAGEITMTVEGKVLGTPAYMSPEQAAGAAHQADRRSDVYSLGVILFELLTGERPFRGNVRMLLHQVVFEDAPSPRRFNSRVPRDLETICQKCLEKKPERRYQTAEEFAADLRHWLNKEPIAARPISRLARTVRWCQRRPAIAALLALVVLVTVLGFTGVTWQWRQTQANFEESERQRDRREANFQKALEAVDRMLTQVGSEDLKDVPQMEEIRRTLLEDALEFYEGFLDEKTDDPDLLAETAHAYRRAGSANSLLGRPEESAAAYEQSIGIFERLARQFPDKPEYIAGLADGYTALGESQRARGKLAEAEVGLRRAIELTEKLTSESPDKEDYRADLAGMHITLGIALKDAGRPIEAEEAYLRTYELASELAAEFPSTPRYRRLICASLNNRANLALDAGDTDEAEKVYRETIQIDSALLEKAPADPDCRYSLSMSYGNLGLLLQRVGRPDEAEEASRKAFELREELVHDFPGVPRYRRLVATSYIDRGNIFWRRNHLKEAEQQYRKGVELQQQLVAQVPSVAEYRYDLCRSTRGLAEILAGRRRFDESEQVYRKALALAEELVRDFPGNSEYARELVNTCSILAGMLASVGRIGEGQGLFESLIAAFEDSDTEDAEEYRRRLLRPELYFSLGAFHEKHGDEPDRIAAYAKGFDAIEAVSNDSMTPPKDLSAVDEMCERLRSSTQKSDLAVSERACRIGIRILRRLVEEYPKREQYGVRLGSRYRALGTLLEDTARWEEAEGLYSKLIELREGLVAEYAEDAEHRRFLAFDYGLLGGVLQQTDRPDEAKEVYRKALQLREELRAESPEDTELQTSSAGSYQAWGDLLCDIGKHWEAELPYRRSCELREALLAKSPDNAEYQSQLAGGYYRLAYTLFALDRDDEAKGFFLKSVELLENLVVQGPSSVNYRKTLSDACYNLANVFKDTGCPDEAVEAYRRCAELLEKLAAEFPENSGYRSRLASSYYRLGVVLTAIGRDEEAEKAHRQSVTVLEQLVVKLPENSEYRVRYAIYWSDLAWLLTGCEVPELRDPDEAVKYAEKATHAEPEASLHWRRLGAAQYRAGKWKTAAESLEKATELSSGGGSMEWFFLAMVHWQQGNKDEARQWYHKAVEWMEENAPEDDELRRFRSEAAELLGVAEQGAGL